MPHSGAQSTTAFAGSLPAEYRHRFNPAEIAAHAHVVQRRGGLPVSVGRFPWSDPEVAALCINALDRPGLLSLISRTMSEIGMQVKAAEAFCRDTKPREALDFFWVWDKQGVLTDGEIERFAQLLTDGILGKRPDVAPHIAPAPSAGTTVRFLENKHGTLSVLEVETEDRSGLLWAISQALHQSGVQIVGSQIRTEASRVLDRFMIEELEGGPIRDERRWQIQVAILTALESAQHQ